MIVVAGEALIDLTPSALGDGSYRPHPGGGPFNTAVGLGRLGVPVAFLGSLGGDGFSAMLSSRLREADVDLSLARAGHEPTTLAVVSPGLDGRENEFSFYVEATAAAQLAPDDLPGELPAHVDALHVGTLGLLLEPIGSTLEELIAEESRRRVIGFDPNIRPSLVKDRARYTARLDRVAALADVVKLSAADAGWLAGAASVDVLVERWLAAGAGVVVVTDGGEGATARCATGAVVHVPATVVEVVDTVGAGDAFNTGLLAWLHDHGRLTKAGTRGLGADDLAAALRFAADIAARTCARAGADPPWRHELTEPPS